MNNMAFCIHGHFYQPPREDPLTGEIPIEPGAAPYRNWNERINAQCYRPNAQLGNFAHISFNVGPTLMQWLEKHDPETLHKIIEQEQQVWEKFGVSNGMAQSYNHTILPLASYHDKVTQVRWGIADFEYRFGHRPQGIWLPETAADDETLEVLVECGIEFTILAPWQANTNHLDASQPYRVPLPGGKYITVFFYNQDLSTRVSFDPGATVNADRFVIEGLIPKFRTHKGTVREPQIVMVASDGELYGHHQPFRDKFLSYLMDGALSQQPMVNSFPALWMRHYPPQNEITIHQKSSWSCYHGVTRWMGSCSCTSDNAWKEPFRQALDGLAAAIDEQYLMVVEGLAGDQDPWELRHQYIQVILGQKTLEELLESLWGKTLGEDALQQVNLLLRAQFERQRIFTSCGWFFEDFSRIEPRNNVSYAAQAVWLTEKATGVNLAPLAMEMLCGISSTRTGLRADQVFSDQFRRAKETWNT
jgi:alpha-amylase/alpha-mannosidase (GH57 family)